MSTGTNKERLEQNNVLLEDIKTKVQNLPEASGGEIKPNIFVQETEPTTKDGIWVQGTYQVDNKIAVENITTGDGEWNLTKMSNLKAIPYEFFYGSAVSVGTDIYLFGGTYTVSNRIKAYKYDTLTDTYTQLANIPYNFASGSAVSIGTDIYLLGGSDSSQKVYKYDTLTDTYTQLANIPYFFSGGSAVSVGTNIYLFGGTYSSDIYIKAYKYDTITDTYTKLTNIPYAFYSGSAVSIGTDIYLLGGSDNTTTAYKYDTLTDTYTQLANIPYEFRYGSAVSVETNIYLLGSNYSDSNRIKAYKYDTLTDTYTQLANIPYAFYYGSAVSIGTDIYLLGGEGNKTKVQIFTLPVNDYGNNTLVIDQSSNVNKTKIVDIGITDAKFFYNKVYYQNSNGELVSNLTTYNGNGTEWTQIS